MKTIVILFFVLLSLPTCGQVLEGTTNAVKVTVGKKNEPAQVVVAQETTQEADMAATLESLGITKLPKYYALIVGVSEYQNAGPGLPNLEMPAKDAEKLYNVLTERYSFDPQLVKLLKNPTEEQIIDQFHRLAEVVTDKDNVLIFYAGHGFYDKARDFGYWLPTDAKLESRSAWIPNSTIKDYVGAIKSKHTLLITDACFGGSIFKTRAVTTMIKRFNEVYRDNSRKALTSGNLTEVPDNSIFLKYLIKNLEENNDIFLPSTTLFSRIYEPIVNNTTTLPLHGVIQGAGDEGGDFVFIKKK